MGNRRFSRAVTAAMASLLLLQSTPGGILTAYAANNGIVVEAKADELKEELASKSSDYPAGAIAFYEPTSTVVEGDGDREIKIVRWGDASARTTVDVKVFALTATYGEDFEVYTTRGLGKDVLEEQSPEDEAAVEAEADAELTSTPESDAQTNAAPEDTAADDAVAGDGDDRQGSDVGLTDSAESNAADERAEEKVPFAAAAPAEEPAEQATPAPAQDDASEEDGISSMRESYAIQTGNDTKRTNWRGEYEESVAPVAAVEAADDIAGQLPGAAGTLTFEPGEYVKTVHISVKDDDLAESKEAFKLLLGNVSAGVLGEQLQHNVSIEDNEEGERIAFAMRDAEVTVEPGAEYAEVCVVRTSGKDYYAGAVVRTAADTAVPETAYEPIDGATIAFSSGATEQVVRIPLKDTAQAGTQFIVRLDVDASNVDGNPETVVKIVDDPKEPVPAPKVGEELQGPMAAPNTEDSALLTAAALRYEHAGIVYDGTTVSPRKRGSSRGVNVNASLTYSSPLSSQASRIIAKIKVSGYTDWGLWNEYGKNWSMCFGDRRLINGRGASGKRHYEYTEQFNISWDEGNGGDGLWLNVNTDGGNHEAIVELQEITYYYPRFTVTMDDADYEQTLKGKNYTSVKEYKEFNVPALSKDAKDRTETLKHDGDISLAPEALTSGVTVDHYEVYCGKTKIGESSSSYLHYKDLSAMRKNNDELLRSNKYKVRVRPVYAGKPTTVWFDSQDAGTIGFSGDVAGKKGFKTGDVLEATQIDTVTMTTECPTGQKIKPLAISEYKVTKKYKWEWFKYTWTTTDAHVQDIPADGNVAFTVSKYPLKYSGVRFKAMHGDASLTYEYTPSETGAVNAGVGAVAAYNVKDLNTPIGVSNYQTPLTIRDSLEMVAGKQYAARVLKGDGFQDGSIVDGIPYSTRTIWTYTDPKTGQKASTVGNAFMFDPYYGDEVVNYHFKSTQDDAKKAGVKGTVYIQEKPLFSTNAKQTSKPAVGVALDVSGENARTDQSGKYEIAPKFNKSDYVSAFLTYDSLTMMSNVAISADTVKDFYINVDENDGLKVTGSTISKLVNTKENDMNNKKIFENRTVQSVLLEDAAYTFNVSAAGSAGITPGKAEFRFYDKKGNLLSDKTVTANFQNGTASLELNPSAHRLSVGDSMTVKLYDTRGRGYFEHQTSVIVGKKAEGMYTFNYEGTKKEDDSLFLKALGGISMGYDFVLDMLSANAGTYEDEQGGQHQLMYIGFGDGFQNQGSNAEREVYNTLQQAVANIDDVNTGAYKLDSNDSLAFFGSGSWAFDIKIGVIYDMLMEDSGDRKGEFKFNDYLILADATTLYNKEWKVSVGPVNLTFNLQFGMGDPSNGTSGVSVKWRFYDPDDQGYFVEDNASLDLLADKNIRSKGYFGLDARVLGSLRAEFLGDLVGGEGGLTVQVGNRTGFDSEKWNDYGEVLLTPKVKLVVLGMGIPIWFQTWRHEWEWKQEDATAQASAKMMRVIDEGMSPENVLFASTSDGVQEDYSYADRRSGWNAGGNAGLFGLFKGAETTGEQTLQKGFLADSDISLYDLGGGKYIAAFLDAAKGRDDANKMGAYYTVYNGSEWSKPVLLKDDGTADQVPVISDAGDAGVLIAWSSASEKLDVDADLSTRLNAFDIQGAFYKDGELGDVMNITSTTKEDKYADTNPQAVYCEGEDGSGHIKLYYTKSEFSISNREEGEVVGDILNPDQLNLVREYDIDAGEWVDAYDPETEAGIRAKLKADLTTPENPNPTDAQVQAAYDQYLKDWYGQVFLDLAPAVDVAEQLDESGHWVSEPTITPVDADVASSRMVKDSAAISYNGLGLLAYSLDKGGMKQATGDQNLYLQIYNASSNEYHHPIMISGTDAEIGDIQFVRSSYKDADGDAHKLTWLYWKEQIATVQVDEQGDPVMDESGQPVEVTTTSIKRINITSLVGDRDANLIEGDVDGKPFYYVNKAAGNESYAPEQVLVSSTPKAEDGEGFVSIGAFQVKASADGRYNYIAWTQPVTTGEGDATRQERHLFVVREDLHTAEVSAPVQVTSRADQYLTEFDFAVTADGKLDVLAGRQFLRQGAVVDDGGVDTGVKEFTPDPATSELAFIKIEPSDEVAIDDAVESGLSKDGDRVVVDLSTKIRNESFGAIDEVNIEAVDASGKVVYSSKDEELITSEQEAPAPGEDGVSFDDVTDTAVERGLIKLGGGEGYALAMPIPVDASGAYDVTLKVTADGQEAASKRVRGRVPVKLASSTVAASVVERDKIGLSATVSNDSVLASGERTVAFGYLDAEGKQVELGTKKLKSIKPGASADVSVTLDQDFATFESRTLEDGSLVDSRTYYLDLEPEGKAGKADAAADEGVIDEGENMATVVYGTVELRAHASQVALMNKAKGLGAVLAVDDGEGGIARAKGTDPNDFVQVALTVNGELAQSTEEFVNGFKVVWDEVDTDVASVDAAGTLHVKKRGVVELTGRLMPADSATMLGTMGESGEIDNYHTLPASLIKPVRAKLAVGGGASTGDGTIGGGPTGGGTTGGDSAGGMLSGMPGGGLPGTGDALDPMFLMVITAAGAVLVVTGVQVRRRKKMKG